MKVSGQALPMLIYFVLQWFPPHLMAKKIGVVDNLETPECWRMNFQIVDLVNHNNRQRVTSSPRLGRILRIRGPH